MKPYYDEGGITIINGNAITLIESLTEADVLVTDPPFGIAYHSGWAGSLARDLKGDRGLRARDAVLALWEGPALVFGSWKAPRPSGVRMLLVWDTGGALGMGDLSLPWKPSHQEIYVLGSGFTGARTSDVLRFPPVQSTARNGRTHPTEKPVPLMVELIGKCPEGVVLDPFMGTGATLLAAKMLGRRAIGIELDESYCEIAAKRLAQEVLPLLNPPQVAE